MEQCKPARPRTSRLRAPLVAFSDRVLPDIAGALITVWVDPSHALWVKLAVSLIVWAIAAALSTRKERAA